MTTTKKITFVVLLVLVVGVIWYLQSMKVQPAGTSGLPSGGQSIAVSQSATSSSTSPAVANFSSTVAQKIQALAAADIAAGYMPAKEIVDPTGFINTSSSFTLASLIGKKVILLDFWTYSCINCIRTIPHLNVWNQQYASSGLEIVGIHTPEFDFEKQYSNVAAAVKQYGITYPVVMDSNYGTWNAYGNLYWPEEYLIDMAGYVVHQNIGEGDYDTTQSELQTLVDQRAAILGLPTPQIATTTTGLPLPPSSGNISPETYFGAERNEFLANGTQMAPGVQAMTIPSSTQDIAADSLYLGGSWTFDDQYATNNVAGAKVVYEYDASNVYFVASASASTTIEVLQDGQPLPAADSGADVHDGKLVIGSSRLYSIVSNSDGSGVHTLEFIIQSPGLQAYTFTFG